MSEQQMTDAELDAWMRRANADMLARLDERIDTKARLRQLLREAGVTPEQIEAVFSEANPR